jgi:hypothetical protein
VPYATASLVAAGRHASVFTEAEWAALALTEEAHDPPTLPAAYPTRLGPRSQVT